MLGQHFLGLYEKAIDEKLGWTQRLELAKSLGFDFMEISIDEKDERIARLDWTKEQREELLGETRRIGVPLRSMCLSAHRRFPFGSADPVLKKRAYEIMEQAIVFAEDLGIHVVQLAGYDVYYEPSTKESVEAFLEGMKWSCKVAEQHQVMLAMEIMDTPFLNSITKYLWYDERIRSPYFCVYPDMGNLSAWPENTVDAEWEKGMSRIVAVHVKETQKVTQDFPGKFKCVPFGTGCVNFVHCFEKLEQLGYVGPYMIEMWSDPDKDDVVEIKKAVEFVRAQYEAAMKRI